MNVKQGKIPIEWQELGPETRRGLQEGWVAFWSTRSWMPPTDVYENERGLVVQVEIAGMSDDDLVIKLNERTLVIEGVRRDPEVRRAYHQMEIRYGAFRAEVLLPRAVDAERVEATYEDGFLRILFLRPPVHRVPVVSGEE